jgi:soluble lytic murein transglycosylase-like protein
MRHLPLFVVLCSLTIFGTGTVRGEETRDQAPAPAAAAESATNAGEQSVPPAAAAKPIIERSKREICDTLVQSAQSNALPIPFFIRLLLQESGFRSDVVSRAGAQGIAQFVPETARSVGLDNPFDPLQAIAASARLLRNLVTKFGNLGLAAAAYNAGPRRISDWLVRKSKLPQ